MEYNLIMPIFEYLTFVCEQSDLQNLLSRYGPDGWRLHTCEPVVTIGPSGSGIMKILVVMDRAIFPEPEEAEIEPVSEGIAMKG